MCQFPSCSAANDNATAAWAVGRLCKAHYDRLVQHYTHADSTLPNAVTGTPTISLAEHAARIADWLKIHVLFHYNEPECLAALQKTHTEVSKRKSVSRALEHYESICWFPLNRVILTGLLSSEAFYLSSALGMNTDPGAGLAHGALSHRFQWNIIMRHVTADFRKPFDAAAGWSFSPLELFWDLQTGVGLQLKAWGKLMDAQANRGFGNPDNVMAKIRDASSGMMMFKTSLDHRFERLDKRAKAVQGIVVDLAPKQPWIMRLSGGNLSKTVQVAGELVHFWKKSGGPPASVKKETMEAAALLIWTTLYNKEETRTFAVSSRPGRYEAKPGMDNLLVGTGRGQDVISADFASRSHTRLNTSEFESSSSTGVLPRGQL